MTFAVGSLVQARGREWVVLPDTTDDLVMLRPLGGTEDEVTGILTELEDVSPATFNPPDPSRAGDHRSAQLLRDALRLGFRSSAGPFRSFGNIAVEPRPYRADIGNRDFLAAVRHLAFVEVDRVRRAIDYRNLGSEELGSVYESLLELHPDLNIGAGTFSLSTAAGHERKTTGSYYTPTSLIATLLDAALDPLLDAASREAESEAALLNLKVLDPACGSGHFLVAAAHRIAKRLATVRTGDDEPPPEATRRALRDVVGRCLYGIDLNPMAVELCKVSLWMEALEAGRPLSFLEHRIVCGNALIGTTPVLLAGGIPDAAFTVVEGDDKTVVQQRRKSNALQRSHRDQALLPLGDRVLDASRSIAQSVAELDAEDDATLAGIKRKSARWSALRGSSEAHLAQIAADTWCAAFFAAKIKDSPSITDRTLRSVEADLCDDRPALESIAALADRYRFVHPHLTFPTVFEAKPTAPSGWTGGFDLVIGNPPWDTLSPDQREFFGRYRPGMRSLSPVEQEPVVAELLTDPMIAERWAQYRRDLFAAALFFKASGRYTLFAAGNLGKGDFNIYRMFVEAALRLTRIGGYTAQITPGGLYGGANASAIRKYLLDCCRLEAVLGFDNYKKPWFDVDIARFAIYVAQAGGRTSSFQARFGLASPQDLANEAITVDADWIRRQAPDTYAIADLRDSREMTVAARMVSEFPTFGDLTVASPARHYQAEVHMGNDTDLFTTDVAGLPLYEGRMIDHYDHRAKIYVSGHGNSAAWRECPFDDPSKAIVPQWRVLRRNIPPKLGNRCDRYRVGFMNVASPRDRRSLKASLIPPHVVCGDVVPTIVFGDGEDWAYIPLLGVANAIVVDWLVRGRLSGAHVTYTVFDSLPLARLPLHDERTSLLAPEVLRLVCTAPEMTPFWNTMAQYGWCSVVPIQSVPAEAYVTEPTRTAGRARVDAIVAKLVYGLQRDEVEFIVDTFPVLRRWEERNFGEYRTKRLILESYAAL